MRRLYEQLGAHVVEGGSTLNPSTFELLAGIHEVAADEVVVLPNSANVIMAAERAAELSEKDVAVVESRWPQAGLAVPRGARPRSRASRRTCRGCATALDGIRTGAVAPAARDDKQGRFSAGDAVGFVDEEMVAWGAPEETLRAVLEALADGSRAPDRASAGDGAPLDDDGDRAPRARRASRSSATHGGQPHYWWLLAAE